MDYLHFVKDGKGEYKLHGDVDVKGMLCIGSMEVKGSTGMDFVQIVRLRDF